MYIAIGIILALGCTILCWVVFHKLFDIVYFSGDAIFKEIFSCFFAGIILTGLALYIWWLVALVCLGIAIYSFKEKKGEIAVLCVVIGILVSIGGISFKATLKENVVVSYTKKEEKTFNKIKSKMESNEYDKALELLSKYKEKSPTAYDYFDCDELVVESIRKLIESGKYEKAISLLTDLKKNNIETYDYFNCDELVKECNVKNAENSVGNIRKLIESGKYEKAISLLTDLKKNNIEAYDYFNCDELVKECNVKNAENSVGNIRKLIESGKYEKAISLLTDLKKNNIDAYDYFNCEEMHSLCKKKCIEQGILGGDIYKKIIHEIQSDNYDKALVYLNELFEKNIDTYNLLECDELKYECQMVIGKSVVNKIRECIDSDRFDEAISLGNEMRTNNPVAFSSFNCDELILESSRKKDVVENEFFGGHIFNMFRKEIESENYDKAIQLGEELYSRYQETYSLMDCGSLLNNCKEKRAEIIYNQLPISERVNDGAYEEALKLLYELKLNDIEVYSLLNCDDLRMQVGGFVYNKILEEMDFGNYQKAILIAEMLEKYCSEIYKVNNCSDIVGELKFLSVNIDSGKGFVFYDCDADNDYGNPDGLISDECGWRYLEAAPEDLDGIYAWGDDGIFRTSETVGSGKSNTEMIAKASTNRKRNAAQACMDYSVNGYDDWFLPSKDELDLMYQKLAKEGYGSFEVNQSVFFYWSSTERRGDKERAWSECINYGDWRLDDGFCRYAEMSVRPIRAF